MSKDQPASEAVEGRTQLAAESGQLSWSELVRYFARGVVIKIDPSLDLIKVGECMAGDNSEQLQQWLDASLVARASDDDARVWASAEPEPQFMALVTAPWVLVQEIQDIKGEIS